MMFLDPFGRAITYLRISPFDRRPLEKYGRNEYVRPHHCPDSKPGDELFPAAHIRRTMVWAGVVFASLFNSLDAVTKTLYVRMDQGTS